MDQHTIDVQHTIDAMSHDTSEPPSNLRELNELKNELKNELNKLNEQWVVRVRQQESEQFRRDDSARDRKSVV